MFQIYVQNWGSLHPNKLPLSLSSAASVFSHINIILGHYFQIWSHTDFHWRDYSTESNAVHGCSSVPSTYFLRTDLCTHMIHPSNQTLCILKLRSLQKSLNSFPTEVTKKKIIILYFESAVHSLSVF